MKKVSIIIVLIFLASGCFAQLSKDIDKFQGIQVVEEENKKQSFSSDNTGVFFIITKQLFMLYKQFISSQDANRCPYAPSCSTYMLQSIDENNFISGLLNGLDRWTRCNGRDLDKYFMDHEKHKLIDPPNYRNN